jgi:uncharacterized protein DUF1569
MTINTKTAPTRTLTFDSTQDLCAELDRLETAHNAGTLTTTGNWSPGQIFDHCARVPMMALDGATFKAPLIIRLLFKFPPLKKKMLSIRMPRGIKLRGSSAIALTPDPSLSFEQGLQTLRQQLQRIKDGDLMTLPSPVFGKMTHSQWLSLNQKHCAMHFGFMQYPED